MGIPICKGKSTPVLRFKQFVEFFIIIELFYLGFHKDMSKKKNL